MFHERLTTCRPLAQLRMSRCRLALCSAVVVHLLCPQGHPYLEEMKQTAKYIATRGKGILARWVLCVNDAVLCSYLRCQHVCVCVCGWVKAVP
jgi:hypothetical protein